MIYIDKINQKIIPYDIVDTILTYLNYKDSKNFLISSPQIYHDYRYCRHFYTVFIKKVCEHFSSLSKLKINYKSLADQELSVIYSDINKLYNNFYIHKHTSLSEFLIYLCDNSQDSSLFEMIISHCYFSKNGDYIYNALRADDITYLLTFYDNLSIITKYIYIDAVILLNIIKYKIMNKKVHDTLYLINYLLFKHFFRYSRFIEDIITDIVCELIKSNDIENINLLDSLYRKRKYYKFKLNYQKIINACMQQKHVDVIIVIYNNMMEQENRDPILITSDYIRLLMKNKYYKVLDKIIELYLGDTINMKKYVDELYNNFDRKNTECKRLLRYLNERNKNRFERK